VQPAQPPLQLGENRFLGCQAAVFARICSTFEAMVGHKMRRASGHLWHQNLVGKFVRHPHAAMIASNLTPVLTRLCPLVAERVLAVHIRLRRAYMTWGLRCEKLAALHTHLSTRSAVFGSVGYFAVFVRAASSTVTQGRKVAHEEQGSSVCSAARVQSCVWRS
jgi:hypothetical protein